MENGVVGQCGPSVLGHAANQWRLDRVYVYHHSTRVALAKVLPKNNKNVSCDPVKVSDYFPHLHAQGLVIFTLY